MQSSSQAKVAAPDRNNEMIVRIELESIMRGSGMAATVQGRAVGWGASGRINYRQGPCSPKAPCPPASRITAVIRLSGMIAMNCCPIPRSVTMRPGSSASVVITPMSIEVRNMDRPKGRPRTVSAWRSC